MSTRNFTFGAHAQPTYPRAAGTRVQKPLDVEQEPSGNPVWNSEPNNIQEEGFGDVGRHSSGLKGGKLRRVCLMVSAVLMPLLAMILFSGAASAKSTGFFLVEYSCQGKSTDPGFTDVSNTGQVNLAVGWLKFRLESGEKLQFNMKDLDQDVASWGKGIHGLLIVGALIAALGAALMLASFWGGLRRKLHSMRLVAALSGLWSVIVLLFVLLSWWVVVEQKFAEVSGALLDEQIEDYVYQGIWSWSCSVNQFSPKGAWVSAVFGTIFLIGTTITASMKAKHARHGIRQDDVFNNAF